jgi:hypothetical protein
MQRFIAFFLARSLFETWTLTSKPKLNYLLLVVVTRAFAAYLYNALHVAALCSNEATSNLKLLIVVNLYIKSAGILNIVIIIIRSIGIVVVITWSLYSINRRGRHRHFLTRGHNNGTI